MVLQLELILEVTGKTGFKQCTKDIITPPVPFLDCILIAGYVWFCCCARGVCCASKGCYCSPAMGSCGAPPISAPLVTQPVLCSLLYLGIHIGLTDYGRLEYPGVGQS